MVGVVLALAGLITFVYGTSRGYAAARAALMPLVRDGEPTRDLVDATRPLHARVRVAASLVSARQVAASLGWLFVAVYGLLLATVGATVLG